MIHNKGKIGGEERDSPDDFPIGSEDDILRGAPSFSRVTVTAQPGRRIVYVLAYLPEARGAGVNMIEEPLDLNDFSFGLRLDGRTPSRMYLAPEEEGLDFSVEGGYVEVRVPQVRGWAGVVFEE